MPLKQFFTFCILIVTTTTVYGVESEARTGRNNIVMFLIDDLGWSDLGCQGSEYYRTPNIDKLAQQGVRFTDAYACLLYTSPSPRDATLSRMPSSA